MIIDRKITIENQTFQMEDLTEIIEMPYHLFLTSLGIISVEFLSA